MNWVIYFLFLKENGLPKNGQLTLSFWVHYEKQNTKNKTRLVFLMPYHKKKANAPESTFALFLYSEYKLHDTDKHILF